MVDIIPMNLINSNFSLYFTSRLYSNKARLKFISTCLSGTYVYRSRWWVATVNSQLFCHHYTSIIVIHFSCWLSASMYHLKFTAFKLHNTPILSLRDNIFWEQSDSSTISSLIEFSMSFSDVAIFNQYVINGGHQFRGFTALCGVILSAFKLPSHFIPFTAVTAHGVYAG